MAKKALASKTGEVKYLQQGPVGGFNELTFENNEYHYCNKIAISKSGVYEFMSLGAIWILTKGTDVAYSYAELEERTYEDPIN